MDSSPEIPPVGTRYAPPTTSGTRSKEMPAPLQAETIAPRMVSRLPVQMMECDRVNEDSSKDFSFDELMIASSSDRPEGALESLQHLPRLSVLCCHADDAATLVSVRDAILSGENIHQKDLAFGRTPLHWACMFSSVGTVDFLLAHGAVDDINELDVLDATPLACLIRKREIAGHEAIVRRMLDAGARLDLLEDGGHALMFEAYLTPLLAGMLLQKGLHIDCINTLRETPLQVAAARGDAILVEFLIAHGADVNRRCLLGCTALHDGELEASVAICLLRGGAQVDARDDLDQTPLMLACDFSNMPLIQVLLRHGASPLAKSQDGLSALDYAKKSGAQVYQYLLECAGLIPGVRLASQ